MTISSLTSGLSANNFLHREYVRTLHGLIVTSTDASYPLALTPELEMDLTIVEGTTTPLFVDNLHLIEHHIRTIGFRTEGILYGRQFQLTTLLCTLNSWQVARSTSPFVMSNSSSKRIGDVVDRVVGHT